MVRPTARSYSILGVPRELQYYLLLPLLLSTDAAALLLLAAGLRFRSPPSTTWYRYVPVRVRVACLLYILPCPCLLRSVRPCRPCLHFGAVVYCARVRYKRGRSRGQHGIHFSVFPDFVPLPYNLEGFVGPARSSGMSFRVGLSHKDVLNQMHNIV